MSLFASLGQGDIWALSGIVFPNSPLTDMLDSGNFTLNELLHEDELIQEVKVKNDRLIEFLCREESVDQLIEYVIQPASAGDSDDRKFKYPYMSCEVICCEIPEILQILTHGGGGKYLEKLFSFLEQENELDCYLAGYFEKILEMLFRKVTTHMMNYFNDCGIALLKLFLSHVQNYSIMQIIQRLMLPHLPFSMQSDSDGMSYDEPTENDKCRWSLMTETCELLLNSMLESSHPDVPLHVSDMLITVLQLSPPETLLITYLCRPESIKTLLANATNNSFSIGENHSVVKSNIALAATSVLESLVSRLYESCFPVQQIEPDALAIQEQAAILAIVHDQINQICGEIVPFVPEIASVLTRILANKNQTEMTFQSKSLSPRLGHHGLQIIKLIESLTRIDSDKLDLSFCENKLFEICMELFLTFEYNSVLHLSVQRIFVSIFEGSSKRIETQTYICSKSNLLTIIMERLGLEDSFGEHQQLSYFRGDESHATFSTRHSSLVGNLVLIAHSAFLLLDSTEREDQGSETSKTGDNLTIDVSDGDIDRAAAFDAKADKESQERAMLLRETMANPDLMQQWDVFSFSKLKAILDHQMLGSYEVPPPELSVMQQEEQFKAALTAEMDPFEFEDDDHRNLDFDEFGDNQEVDFGATIRGSDEFWSANFGDDVDHDDDELSQPEPSSSPVIDDFADFSAFDNIESNNSNDDMEGISSSIRDLTVGHVETELDTVQFDDEEA